jgi:hypothetical protein
VANVPRLDYLGSSCGKLLLEPQRTNSILWSEQMNKWGPTNTTVTTNVLVSPDGYQNADTIVINDSTSRVSQNLSLGAGTYTASVYAKLTSGSGTVRINLIVDGVQTAFTFTPTNEWERYTYTVTAATGVTAIQLRGSAGTPTVAFWGAQLELGSYPSSYVNTLGTAVTRGADACRKTGISSLIGQTEGTLFAEVELSKLTGLIPREWFIISDGTTSATTDWVTVSTSGASNNLLRARIAQAGTIKFDQQYTITTAGTYKIAFAYKTGDCALYVNGSSVGTVVTNDAFTLSLDQIITAFTSGTFQLGDGLSQALLFKTRLTNAELATLTTL